MTMPDGSGLGVHEHPHDHPHDHPELAAEIEAVRAEIGAAAMAAEATRAAEIAAAAAEEETLNVAEMLAAVNERLDRIEAAQQAPVIEPVPEPIPEPIPEPEPVPEEPPVVDHKPPPGKKKERPFSRNSFF